MSRRLWTVAAVAGGVLVVAGALLVLLLGEDSVPQSPLPDAVVVLSIDDPGEAERATAAAAVVSGLPDALGRGDMSALSAGAKAEFGDVRAALPAGSVLTVDKNSWRRTGSVASVVATLAVPGQAPATFLVVVVFEDGVWKLSSTIEVPAL